MVRDGFKQIRGERVDARSDVYSLGCVLFQLLSGKVPFDRTTATSTTFAHINDPAPKLGDFAPPLGRFDDVIERAMAKDPNLRFESAGDLGRAAVAAAEMRTITLTSKSVATGAGGGGAGPRVRSWTRRSSTRYRRTGSVATIDPVAPPSPVRDRVAAATQGRRPTFAAAREAVGGTGIRRSARPPRDDGLRQHRERPSASGFPGGVAPAAVIGVLVIGGGVAPPQQRSLGTRQERCPTGTGRGRRSTTSGSGACDYLSPANITNHYKNIATRRKELAGATATRLGGTHRVDVTGTTATYVGLHRERTSDPGVTGQAAGQVADRRDRQPRIPTPSRTWLTDGGGIRAGHLQVLLVEAHRRPVRFGVLRRMQKAKRQRCSRRLDRRKSRCKLAIGDTGDRCGQAVRHLTNLGLSKQSSGHWLIDMIDFTDVETLSQKTINGWAAKGWCCLRRRAV